MPAIAMSRQRGRITILDAATGRVIRKLEGAVNVASALVFDTLDHRLYSGQKTAWNLDSGRGERILGNTHSMTGILGPDGRMLVEPSGGNADVWVWDVSNDKLVATLSPKSEALAEQIAFSPDGKRLAVTYRMSASQAELAAVATVPILVAPASTAGLRPPVKSGKGKKGSAVSIADIMQAVQAGQAAV